MGGGGGVNSYSRHVHMGKGDVKKWPIFVNVINGRPLLKSNCALWFVLYEIHPTYAYTKGKDTPENWV